MENIESEKTESYSTEQIEYYIVKHLLEDNSFLIKFEEKINADLFSAKFQDIIKGIKICFKKCNKVVTLKQFEDIVIPKVVNDDIKRIEIAKETLLVIKSIEKFSKDVENFIYEKTEEFIKNKRVLNVVYKHSETLFLKPETHGNFIQELNDAQNVCFKQSEGIDYFSDFEKRLNNPTLSNESISTGLPSLDALFGGGYRRKALFVYAGPSNVGKSLVLVDAASTLALKGYNVVYISLELSREYIAQRVDAKISEVAMNIINSDPGLAIKTAVSRMEVFKQSGNKIGKLFITDYAPNTASCNDIKSYLKTLETQTAFKPDFIIIDYIKLLNSIETVKGDNLYNILKRVTLEMRTLAIIYNACVISASQTNRQSYGSASVGAINLSDSICIMENSDVLVTLARNTALDQENTMLMSLEKSRFSRNEGSMQVRIDYDHMKLIDISIGSTHNSMTNRKEMVPSPMPVSKKEKPKSDNVSETDFNLEI